jgi:hypothetical protein
MGCSIRNSAIVIEVVELKSVKSFKILEGHFIIMFGSERFANAARTLQVTLLGLRWDLNLNFSWHSLWSPVCHKALSLDCGLRVSCQWVVRHHVRGECDSDMGCVCLCVCFTCPSVCLTASGCPVVSQFPSQ